MRYVIVFMYCLGIAACSTVDCKEDQQGTVTCASPRPSTRDVLEKVHPGHVAP